MVTNVVDKIAGLFGKLDFSYMKPSEFDEIFDKYSHFHQICHLFPYQFYEEKYQLFFNAKRIGFVFELSSLETALTHESVNIRYILKNLGLEQHDFQSILIDDPLNTFTQNNTNVIANKYFLICHQNSPDTKITLQQIDQLKNTIKAKLETQNLLGLQVKVWNSDRLLAMLSRIVSHKDSYTNNSHLVN